MSNVIHSRYKGGNIIHQHVNSNDRGPKGETGAQGVPGKDGTNVRHVRIENGHMIFELSDGVTEDAGKVPAFALKRLYVGEMDGTRQEFTISPAVDPAMVAGISINGVDYADFYSLSDDGATLTTLFEVDEVPQGKLEIVYNEYTYSDYEREKAERYTDLTGKPTLNGITIEGNKNGSAYGLVDKATMDSVTARVDMDIAELQNTDSDLQEQIDSITSASDVVDVVDTYADLQAYDTSKIKPNDVIKVLQDEEHDGAITYYRWVEQDGTPSWTYVGATGPYYTKSEADTLLDGKVDKVEGMGLSTNNYTTAEKEKLAGLNNYTLPAASDSVLGGVKVGEGLSIDEDGVLNAGGKMYNEFGLNTDGGITQKDITKYFKAFTDRNMTEINKDSFVMTSTGVPYYGAKNTIWIGDQTSRNNPYTLSRAENDVFLGFGKHVVSDAGYDITDNVAIGQDAMVARTEGKKNVAIGSGAKAVRIDASGQATNYNTAIGADTSNDSNANNSVALGYGSKMQRDREVSVGSGNATNGTRFVANVTDPELPQDAATKNYVDTAIAAAGGGGGDGSGVVEVELNMDSNYISIDDFLAAAGTTDSPSGVYNIWVNSTVNGRLHICGRYEPGVAIIPDIELTAHDGTEGKKFVGTLILSYKLSYSYSFIYLPYNVSGNSPNACYHIQHGYKESPNKSATVMYGATADNLTTSDKKFPLSAKQGVVLKGLIDGLTTSKQDTLTAGDNITITTDEETGNTVISSTGGGGGGDVTLYDGTGTNTDGAMTQLAASNLIYPSGYEANKGRIAIGANPTSSSSNTIAIGSSSQSTSSNTVAMGTRAKATNNSSIALGYDTTARGMDSIAIGTNAQAGQSQNIAIGYMANANANNLTSGSVAIGGYATITRGKEVSFGAGSSGTGTATRYLANVTDPELPQDAATKNYVDTAVASASGAATITNEEWSALWQ